MAEPRKGLGELFRGTAPQVADDVESILRANQQQKPAASTSQAAPVSLVEDVVTPVKKAAPSKPTRTRTAPIKEAPSEPEVAPAPRAVGRPALKERDPEIVAPRGYYVPSGVKKWLRDEARAREITQTDLLVIAFDAVDVDTLKESFSTMPVQPPGGMPRAPIGKRKTSRVEDGVQTSLRLTGAQEDWIEELRETVGAHSKSALVSTVLKTYMGMPKGEK